MKTPLRLLVIMLLLGAAFVSGYCAHRAGLGALIRGQHKVVDTKDARPFRGDAFPLQSSAAPSGDEARDSMLAMGYLQGSQQATAQSGVTICDDAAAQPGLNLYNSGHAAEATLMDMHGKTLHTWKFALQNAWPDYKLPEYVREAAQHFWRRVYLYPNGDLLAIFEGIALLKLDKDSHLQWVYKAGCHHDVTVAPNGEIYVLTSEPREGIIDNGVAILGADGAEHARFSLLDAFRNSPYAPLLDALPKVGDVLHINTLKILDGAQQSKSPAFKAGNLLISSLTLNTIAVVDREQKTVQWALTGMTRAQHEPTFLPSGDLLVFDNRGAGEMSRVLEIVPLTQHVVWQYPKTPDTAFFSKWCGAAARLPNGNTLVTVTDNGRALEVTPDHRVVWEFYNPNQFEERGVRMVAALFELKRIPADALENWYSVSTS